MFAESRNGKLTHKKKKRIRDEDNSVEPIEEHPVEQIDDHEIEINKAVPGDEYVHKFGADRNDAVSLQILADLLLLTLSKGIAFKFSPKGRPTWPNFQCYTGCSLTAPVPYIRIQYDCRF